MKLVRDQFPMTFSTSFFTECIEVYGTYKQGGGPQALDLAARSKGQFFFKVALCHGNLPEQGAIFQKQIGPLSNHKFKESLQMLIS